MEEELREGWERRETRDPKWLDWIKMAGVREHLSFYTIIAWLYIHVQPNSPDLSAMINFGSQCASLVEN